MKKFRFKLQTLLDQRQTKVDNLLAQLAELRAEERKEIAQLVCLQKQLKCACESIEKVLKDGADLGKLAQCDEYAKTARDDIKVQELTIEAVRARVESKRLEVVDAMKDLQVLEALRDKQERAYMLEYARAEQNEIDEMASLRYARGI